MPSLKISLVDILVISRPLNIIFPLMVGSNPQSVFSRVDFPAPFGPIIVVVQPSLAIRDTSDIIGTSRAYPAVTPSA